MPEISCLRKKYFKHERRVCKESGSFAKLRLSGYRNKIALKSDSIERSKKMCDYFVFVKDHQFILSILELKEKNLGCDNVFEKLNNGSILISSLFNECCLSVNKFLFFPILLHHGARSPSEIKMLKTKTIIFRGKKYWIICEEGICELSDIITKY
jgi:hypothetical protein